MKIKAPSLASIAAFKAQVGQWAERIRAKPRQIRIQKMRRKWASCSTRGTVSFNPEVLAQSAAFREFVIVHELLHLKVPNHGKLFKILLRAYLPNYEATSDTKWMGTNDPCVAEAATTPAPQP